MLGGYQILDLRKIDLTITKTQSNITDAYVLSQLLKLRDFIDKDYDFSKPIENQLKPVLIRYRDKKNGEKSEGAMFGELAVVDNYYTFKITGRISGALILTIKVAFQEITNAYDAKEWVINTAKIQLQDVLEDLEGNLALEGDLSVSGDVAVGGDLVVTGKISSSANFTRELVLPDTAQGLSKVYAYAVLNQENNILEYIIACKYTNNTEADITINANTVIFGSLYITDLPEDLASKIYRLDGTNLSEEDDAEASILIDSGAYFVSASNMGQLFVNMYSVSPRSMTHEIINTNQITIPSGSSLIVGARVFLKL